MCEYLSALVLRNGDIVHSPYTDSHSDLILSAGLDENDTPHRGEPRFSRVEFRPADPADLASIEKYRLVLDEGREPEWFAEHREKVESTLRRWADAAIIRSPVPILFGGRWVVAKGGRVGRLVGGTIVANFGVVTVNYGTVVCNSGTVTAGQILSGKGSA